MSRTATIILNRNLPEATNRLYEQLRQHDGAVSDFFVVESGSDQNNLSKYCTWRADWPDSIENGLRFPRGFNFALAKLWEEKRYDRYEFFFLVCNDIEFDDAPVIGPLMREMEKHARVGILAPCSPSWGESRLLKPDETKYFWYINHTAWLVRREYIETVREIERPNYMNFLYDGENFRGYESEIELIVKGYANDWASAITTKVKAEENKSHLFTKADLIKTEPHDETISRAFAEGKRWMRRKYGFNSRWSMQMYAKFFYDQFFENFPYLRNYKI